MNIWKLTTPTIDAKSMIAIVIALTPNDARSLLRSRLYANNVQVNDPIVCKQLGFASTDQCLQEIISIAIV